MSEGTYSGRIDLLDGVSVWGGYSAANHWQRSSSSVPTFTGGALGTSQVGVLGANPSQPIALGSVRVETADAASGATTTGSCCSSAMTCDSRRSRSWPARAALPVSTAPPLLVREL